MQSKCRVKKPVNYSIHDDLNFFQSFFFSYFHLDDIRDGDGEILNRAISKIEQFHRWRIDRSQRTLPVQ